MNMSNFYEIALANKKDANFDGVTGDLKKECILVITANKEPSIQEMETFLKDYMDKMEMDSVQGITRLTEEELDKNQEYYFNKFYPNPFSFGETEKEEREME